MHTLVHYRICPHSRSVRLALAELAQPFELVEERPWEYRAEFLDVNPSGELPVLQVAGGPLLSGWYAIVEYLHETPAPDADALRLVKLFPGSPAARAEVRRLVDWFQGKLHREVTRELLIERVYARLGAAGDGEPAPDVEILRAARANLRYHLGYIGYLADQRRWLAGDDTSFADLAAAAQLSAIDYLSEVPWDEFPAAKGWYERVKSRPAFRALLADRVPGMAPAAHYASLDF